MDIIQYNALHKFVGVLDNPQHFRGIYRFEISECDRINWVAGLTGFSYMNMHGCFARTKKTGRNY